LIRREEVVDALRNIAVLLPLDAEILARALRLEKPREFEDRIHLATMQSYGIYHFVKRRRFRQRRRV